MNNNKQNGGGNESDIITKKGFLISLPSKKNKDAEVKGSSINFAKPQGNSQNPKTDDKNDGSKDNKKNRGNRDKRHFQNKKADKSNDKTAQNQPNSEKNQNKQGQKQNNNNNKNADNQDFDKRDKNKKHSQQSVKDNKNEQRAANAGNDSQGKKNNKDNRKNDRHGNHNNHNKNNSKQKMAPLSALSSDIALHTKMKSDISERAAIDEISLEEKYKNAKPLAQQIAEQEMRAKGLKIPGENEPEQEKQEIVGVRFREAGKIYYFDPEGKQIPFGTPVIVETARGSEYGFIAISNRIIPVSSLAAPLKKIERFATTADTQKHVYNKDMEKDAEAVFKEKVEKLGLPMNLIYVEYTFDNTRLLFYFTAETRIDFRELVKELASVFRTRIELRQIGVRDEAKTIGGLGICGRRSCCSTFLGDFAQVSIKMAKDQNLSLNAAKISGTCGKLMCCLRYEDKVYEEENARTPKVGSIVETCDGKGVVTEARALKGQVLVSLESSPETPPKLFNRDDVTVVGFNKGMASNTGEDEEDLKHLEN